jgi:hypothetical protein
MGAQIWGLQLPLSIDNQIVRTGIFSMRGGDDYDDAFLPADFFVSGVVDFTLRCARDGS